ncbi:hypothetical protein BDV06DRAFT_220164 [Aspergillus oleicola]
MLGYALVTLAIGIYIDYDADSSLAKVVIYQIIAGVGSGALLTTFLPAVQGALPPADLAPAMATWGCLRPFGSLWGIAIPSAIFNSRFAQYLQRVTDGESLGHWGICLCPCFNKYIRSLSEPARGQVFAAYTSALKNVWDVCLVFSVVAFLLTLVEKEIPMRTVQESNYALKDGKMSTAGVEEGGAVATHLMVGRAAADPDFGANC